MHLSILILIAFASNSISFSVWKSPQKCTTNNDCSDDLRYCSKNKDCILKGVSEDKCEKNSECILNNCVNGICKIPQGTGGFRCKGVQDCNSGLVCRFHQENSKDRVWICAEDDGRVGGYCGADYPKKCDGALQCTPMDGGNYCLPGECNALGLTCSSNSACCSGNCKVDLWLVGKCVAGGGIKCGEEGLVA